MMGSNKSRNITTGGILIGLTIVTLYLSILVPSNTIAFLTISSIFIPIAIIRTNIKTGIFVYIGSSILALILVPLDTSLLFVLYFGIYGIIKFFIEKLNKKPIEIILKIVTSNILIFVAYILFKGLVGNITMAFPIYIMVILLQAFILIYDYALTLLITYYIKKFHNKF